MPPVKKQHTNSRWKDTYYVQVYELIRGGLTELDAARAIGISLETFRRWKDQKPALREAVISAKKAISGEGQNTFQNYVYDRLPTQLKELWDRIHRYEQVDNGILKIEALLQSAGKYARQQLFVAAFIKSSFSVSAACRTVNISRSTFSDWCETDPDFADLFSHMQAAKGDFFESALVDRINEGDSACTIFANRTFNRSRGYSEKVDVNLQATVQHTHKHYIVSVRDLNLPVDVLQLLLDRVRNRKQLESPQGLSHVEIQTPVVSAEL